MRMVYKKYADGTDALVKTDDNGDNVQVLSGALKPRSTSPRVSVFIEVCFDNRDGEKNDALNAMNEILDRLKN